MNSVDIYEALASIVVEKKEECEKRLKSLDKNARAEKKAVQVELGMYSLCLRAGFLYYTTGTRESLFNTFLSQAERIFCEFPKINEAFALASNEEKMKITVALRPEAFIRSQFLKMYNKQLQSAKEAGDVDEAFELKIKIGALGEIFEAWEKWRRENGVYPYML